MDCWGLEESRTSHKAQAKCLARLWIFSLRRFDYQIPAPYLATGPRYTFTNLQVDHAWTRQLSARLRMDNILNSKYHQGFVGFQSVGIHTTVDVLYFR
jgi:hypothetical protein